MLKIISLSKNNDCLRITFDLDGNKLDEYGAIYAIFTALIESTYGEKIKWTMATAQTFGAWLYQPTEWIYWLDGTLEVADPNDNE